MRPDTESCHHTSWLQVALTKVPAGPAIIPVEELSDLASTELDQCRVLLNGLRPVNMVVGWISSICSCKLSGRL